MMAYHTPRVQALPHTLQGLDIPWGRTEGFSAMRQKWRRDHSLRRVLPLLRKQGRDVSTIIEFGLQLKPSNLHRGIVFSPQLAIIILANIDGIINIILLSADL